MCLLVTLAAGTSVPDGYKRSPSTLTSLCKSSLYVCVSLPVCAASVCSLFCVFSPCVSVLSAAFGVINHQHYVNHPCGPQFYPVQGVHVAVPSASLPLPSVNISLCCVLSSHIESRRLTAG